MILNTIRSKLSHICFIRTPESQMSICFSLRPAVSSYMPFEDRVTKWPPNYPQHYKIKSTSNMFYYNPWVPNFSPSYSPANSFWVYGTFWDECTAWPRGTCVRWTVQGQGQSYTKYVPVEHLSSKFQYILLCRQTFSSCRLLRDNCIEWPHWNWTLQDQSYSMYVPVAHRSPKLFHVISF